MEKGRRPKEKPGAGGLGTAQEFENTCSKYILVNKESHIASSYTLSRLQPKRLQVFSTMATNGHSNGARLSIDQVIIEAV